MADEDITWDAPKEDITWDSKPSSEAKGYFGNLSDIVGSAVSDIAASRQQRAEHPSSVFTDWAREGADVASIIGSPFSAAYKTAAPYVASPLASGIQAAGEPIAKWLNPNAKLPTHEEVAQAITPDVEQALGSFGARGVPTPFKPPPGPRLGPLNVPLSEGQATGRLPTIQREQSAIRGSSGKPAERRARQFVDQQAAEIERARGDVGNSFDPSLQTIAQTPHEAGDLISQSMQREAAARRANYDNLFQAARALPGEIHANVFNRLGREIRADLNASGGPTVDPTISPFATRALHDIDNAVDVMEGIRGMQPTPNFTLNDVDLLRKRLSAYRTGAGPNPYDRTATQSIINAFDNRITSAVNSPAFQGDPRVATAWNQARAAYADYRRTFTSGRNDPIGKAVEKIVGRDGAGDLATGPVPPNEVADFLYGGQNVNAKGVQIGVANRIRQIFGDTSPEWSAIRQGLWSRILERPEGMTEWGPRAQANRLSDFLNGKGQDMARAIYSPQERNLMQSYARLMNQVAVPQAGAQWSNNAPFLQRVISKIGGVVGALVGGAVGHATGLPWGAGEVTGFATAKGVQAIGNYHEMRRIARLMPLIGQQIGALKRAGNNAAAGAAIASKIDGVIDGIFNNKQSRASGGRVSKELLSHQSVGYVAKSPHRKRQCSNCSMFIADGPACTLVQPPIAPEGWCRRWDAKQHRADGGAVNASPIDNHYDVVTGANSSKEPKGPIYVDRHIPEYSPKIRAKGKPARLWTYLAVHEDTEQRCMAAGDGYSVAHTKATAAERTKARADGVNWQRYTEEVDGYLDRTEHEKANHPPPDMLHVKPEEALGHHRSHRKK